jgi:hypothetical protein
MVHAVTVSGYVTNLQTKQPVPGAVVNVGGAYGYANGAGWYQVSVAPGNYNVVASATGYLPADRQVNLGQNQTVNFPLSTAGEIRGTVTDSNQKPVGNATVYLTGGQIATTLTLTTNSYGIFQTNWIPIGSYEAFAVLPGSPGPTLGSITQTFTLNTGENHTISLTMLPTSTIANIDQMPGWESCTRLLNGQVCASGIGDAGYSMEENIANPSLNGHSAEFDIWGNVGYSNALFWKQVTPNDNATHFVFDWWTYIEQPQVSQALEFDLNQTVNKTKYIFGSECNFKDTGKWDIWDGLTGKWIPSSLTCAVFRANSWNHFTWNLERVNGKVHYISLAINGTTYPVEMWEYPQSNVDARELNAAVQLDGDWRQDPYSIWVNEISITAW